MKPTKLEKTSRPTVFYLDGGSGRLLCAIPALEYYALTHYKFSILTHLKEEFFKENPILYKYVHNFGEEDVNLSGWTLNGDPLSGTIPAGGYFLAAGEDAFFNADGDELYTGDNIPNSASVNVNLSTSGDEIVLVDGNGDEVDYVAYDDGSSG